MGRISRPETGQDFAPRKWAGFRAQKMGTHVASPHGRELLPIFWAPNPAQFLGAKSCPCSGRVLPSFRVENHVRLWSDFQRSGSTWGTRLLVLFLAQYLANFLVAAGCQTKRFVHHFWAPESRLDMVRLLGACKLAAGETADSHSKHRR